jgi:FAD/FMN-containing dehydrogenase
VTAVQPQLPSCVRWRRAAHWGRSGHPTATRRSSATIPSVVSAPGSRPAAGTFAGALRESELRALGAALRGHVILPGDAGYDAARRGHNTAIDRRPAIIVRPHDTADVSRAIVAARDLGLEIAVKGGGHSLAGHSSIDGGMVVDLGDMRQVVIDPIRRTGSAQGGVLAGEYTRAAHEHGYATPFGDTTTVGLGGLTLGGGMGWLTRKHGLTIDSLLSVELVTADGDRMTVSEDCDPELFWALRGGGGNFGVATRFTYRLHPLDVVTGGALFLPLSARVLQDLVEVSAAAPEDLTQITNVMAMPPAPFVPAELVGTPAVIVLLVHAGDPEAGAAAVGPFRALATPLVDMVGPMPYPAMYVLTAGGEQPGPSVVRSTFLPGLSRPAAEAIVHRHGSPEGQLAMTQLRVLGGAMARVPADATAFAHRHALVMASVITAVGESAAASTAWADAYLAELASDGIGVYSNFMGDEGEARLRAAYPGRTYERLVAVKRRVDPDNVFHANHNIRPG